MSSEKRPFHADRFVSVTEVATKQEDWSATMEIYQECEVEPLPVWETNIHPNYGGWNISLAKREC
jgi:hypothetical protein